MAIHHEPDGSSTLKIVIAEPPRLTLPAASFDAPEAADYFAGLPAEEHLAELRAVLECGAHERKTLLTNAMLQEIEAQIQGLTGDLGRDLRELLAKDRQLAREELAELLTQHRTRVSESMTRYLDPDSKVSVPAAMAKAFEKVVADMCKRVETLVADGDDSALGKLGERLSKEIQQAAIAVVEQTASRHALDTRSNLAGRPYEDEVEERLSRLARPLRDTVQRTTDLPGLLKRKTGDFVIELDQAITGGRPTRLVIEAKRRGEGGQAFTGQRLKEELDLACRNRGAEAAIFVTDSSAVLPSSIGYQEVAPARIAVVLEPQGDDVALAVALGVLRSQMLVALAKEGTLDVEAVREAVAAVRQTISSLELARTHHSAASRSIEKAGGVMDDIRLQVLARLGKLDSLLQ